MVVENEVYSNPLIAKRATATYGFCSLGLPGYACSLRGCVDRRACFHECRPQSDPAASGTYHQPGFHCCFKEVSPLCLVKPLVACDHRPPSYALESKIHLVC